MNKDTKDIINHTSSTVLKHCADGAIWLKYAEQGDVKDKQKMINTPS